MNHSRLISRRELAPFGALGVAVSAYAAHPEEPPSGKAAHVQLNEERGVVDVKIDGRPFAVYNYDSKHAALYRPFFHPVMGPNEHPITQNGEFPGSLRGHYWHRALFVAHQKVNNMSFWEEVEDSMDCGRIIHLQFDELFSGEEGRFAEQLAWRDRAGGDVLHETRAVRVPHSPANRRFIDIKIRLRAAREAVHFLKTPYNLLACRVRDSMCLLSEKKSYTERFGSLVDFSPLNEGGRITNSEGNQDVACRGARARWCDFSGPLGDGSWGGIAILDHPGNPRHPTAWHNWNNMTITASFTFHEPFLLAKGKELRLAYRVVVHSGDARSADIEEAWKSFSKTEPATVKPGG